MASKKKVSNFIFKSWFRHSFLQKTTCSISPPSSFLFCFSERLTRGLKDILAYPAGMNIRTPELDKFLYEVWTNHWNSQILQREETTTVLSKLMCYYLPQVYIIIIPLHIFTGWWEAADSGGGGVQQLWHWDPKYQTCSEWNNHTERSWTPEHIALAWFPRLSFNPVTLPCAAPSRLLSTVGRGDLGQTSPSANKRHCKQDLFSHHGGGFLWSTASQWTFWESDGIMQCYIWLYLQRYFISPKLLCHMFQVSILRV